MITQDKQQLDLMWSFLDAGMMQSNIEVLKEYCKLLRRAMMQKTAGQAPYAKIGDVGWADLGTIINVIVMETMCLYLSGDLDKLEEISHDNHKSVLQVPAAQGNLSCDMRGV